MKRGDIVTAIVRGSHGQPRPFLIVQSDQLSESTDSIIACPVTAELTGDSFRVPLALYPETGLQGSAEVVADKVTSFRKDRIVSIIGRTRTSDLSAVEAVLATILGLRG